ncbi:calcium:proton antiporter [Brachybacterium tyrofermentans]|uniref:calcium:proton antiporter n=1 Tax=Brachybacterium tyrofermentans TaxID=47848 RepID=UPI003FD24C39
MPSLDRSPALTGPRLARAVLTPSAILRLVVGWSSVAALAALVPVLPSPLSSLGLLAILTAIVAVIVLAAGGVVQQAEALAGRLGDPYGTLVLTLSIVVIEVVLIAAVMLGEGDHATIARDSVMAVAMIILNLVFGLCLVVAGVRYGGLTANRTGTSMYVGMLVLLATSAFALPAPIGDEGSLRPVQAAVVAGAAIALYAVFLRRQTGVRAPDFQEVATGPRAAQTGRRAAQTGRHAAQTGCRAAPEDVVRDPDAVSSTSASAAGSASSSPFTPSVSSVSSAPSASSTPSTSSTPGIGPALRTHRLELLARSALLVATVLPIVLLSHHMAGLLDEGLARLGAPAALGGVLIAMIVFTPESITAVRAALGGEIQRVVNLCHGALVSTFALTIPTVLVISLLTGQRVVLAESPTNLVLLGVTLALCGLSARAARMTRWYGIAHLLLAAIYGVALFS